MTQNGICALCGARFASLIVGNAGKGLAFMIDTTTYVSHNSSVRSVKT